MRVLASELSKHTGGIVVMAGWLHRRRQHKTMTFAILRDRSGLTQVLTRDPAVREQIANLPEETVIEVTGTVTADVQAPGGLEITEPTIRTLSDAAVPSPVEVYKPNVVAGLQVILDNAAAALRHPKLRAPFEITAASVDGFRSTLNRLQFTEIFTPKIVGSATESGANVFTIDYFGRPAFLIRSVTLFPRDLQRLEP